VAEVKIERCDRTPTPIVNRPDNARPATVHSVVGPDVRDRETNQVPGRIEQRSIGPDPDHRGPDDSRGLDRRVDESWHLRLAGRATATNPSHAPMLGP
jgi:hypothetical protein